MNHWKRIVLASTLLLAAPGLSIADANMDQVLEQQKKIIETLGTMSKKLEAIEKKVASGAAAKPARRGPDPEKKYTLPIGESEIIGPKDAKVTITEFSDYQCPFCSRAHNLVVDAMKLYPNDVNFVLKHYPLPFHKEARGASQAVIAAGKQGKFEEMHDTLFKNTKALKLDDLKKYATDIGLDMAKFEADMADPSTGKRIDDDMKLARESKVSGTPTIFVDGKLLQNRSVDGFKAMIDAALK